MRRLYNKTPLFLALCYFVSIHANMEEITDVCIFSMDCCVEDCCGNGTFWDGQTCTPDPSSFGFTGIHSDEYNANCETPYACCQQDCCGTGTRYDGVQAYCLPLDIYTPVALVAPSPSPSTVMVTPCESDEDCSKQGGVCGRTFYGSVERVCCAQGSVLIFEKAYCDHLPVNSPCLNSDLLCASGLCIMGTCREDRLDHGASCWNDDKDCTSGACALQEFESSDYVCCASGEKTTVNPFLLSLNFYCTQLKEGQTCGRYDELCAEGLRCLQGQCARDDDDSSPTPTTRTLPLEPSTSPTLLNSPTGDKPSSQGGGTWQQVGQDLVGRPHENFGRRVEFSDDGTTVAVSGTGELGRGIVRVYRWTQGEWKQLGSDLQGTSLQENLEHVALSASGSILAVGAPGNDAVGLNAGRVVVFAFSGKDWKQLGNAIHGKAPQDLSGRVSLSDDGFRIAIGATRNDGANGHLVDSGHVRVFDYTSSGTWEQVGSDIDGGAAGDFLGWVASMSADGTVLAIGAPNSNLNGNSAGQIQIYQLQDTPNGVEWVPKGSSITGEDSLDHAGRILALSGDGSTVIVGLPNNGGANNRKRAGVARVFRYSGDSWIQLGLDFDGEVVNSNAGSAAAVSHDGTIVAFSYSNLFQSNAGDYIEAYQYQSAKNTWIRIGDRIEGKGGSFGSAVSMSGSGLLIAGGAPFNDDGGNDAGQCLVYQFVQESASV